MQVGVGLGVAAVVGFGIAALASAIFSGGKKEKSNK